MFTTLPVQAEMQYNEQKPKTSAHYTIYLYNRHWNVLIFKHLPFKQLLLENFWLAIETNSVYIFLPKRKGAKNRACSTGFRPLAYYAMKERHSCNTVNNKYFLDQFYIEIKLYFRSPRAGSLSHGIIICTIWCGEPMRSCTVSKPHPYMANPKDPAISSFSPSLCNTSQVALPSKCKLCISATILVL